MSSVYDKLDFWKNRLLDLGKRNRLINCTLPKDGKRIQRHSLLISTPTPDDVWATIADGDDTLSFPVPLSESKEQEEIEFEMSLFFSGIQTNQTLHETYKTLRSLMKKAKEFTEEKGLNALHLAFGFLNWTDNGLEGQEMRSPLLLVPVKLTQEDLFSPIVLSRSDEEISANYSLIQKLHNDFGIELPAFTEETELPDYLSTVACAVKSLGWNISNDLTQLSLFSFMKINMYRDLERNSDKICGHHIVRALNGEVFNDETQISDIENYNHDESEPQNVFSVLDADSSQQDAVLLAKRGASFVLQGPPGTGKSQTITNIIAELIADGKKVLFVSEKMAALDVVYKRLSQAGLAPFCLTLHSHNAKRKEILDQFDKSMKMSRVKANLQQDAHTRLYRLKEIRHALNQYSIDLHTIIEPLGKTIYQVSGYLSQYDDFRNIDYVQSNAEKFTPTLLSQCESALEELTRIVKESGYQQNNPWKGCVMTTPPTFEFRQRFLVDVEILMSQINDGLTFFSETNNILGTNIAWGLVDIEKVQKIYDCQILSPSVPAEWLSLNLPNAIVTVNGLIVALDEKAEAQDRLRVMHNFCVDARSKVDISEKVAQENNAVIASISVYNTTLELRNTLMVKRDALVGKKKNVETNFAFCKESSIKERELSESLKTTWQTAKNSILQDFDEKVFALNIAEILERYRTTYRSFIHRIGNSYKRDRLSLFACYKRGTKATFEQTLSLLDTINDTLAKKDSYERQDIVANEAENLVTISKKELDDIVCSLTQTMNTADEVETQLLESKRALLHALETAEREHKFALDEIQKNIAVALEDISETLKREITETTDFGTLWSVLEWCDSFKALSAEYGFGTEFINGVCGRNESLISRAANNIRALCDWQLEINPNYNKYISLFNDNINRTLYGYPLERFASGLVNCKDNFASLEYLIDFRIAEKRLADLGIDAYLVTAREIGLGAEEIIPVYKKCFFRSWLDVIIPRYSSVQEFRRLRQDERIGLFGELDKSHLEISKAIVVSKLISRLPNFDAYSANGEIALLRREMAKQRKLMPTRLLIAALPNLLPALKPCVLMSPLSVSTYLGNSTFEFDAVIFDEASQVRTEDAIGAIFRAKQAIIAGDSKQLPPSDFFTSSISASDEYEEDENGGINDAGAYESLLDEATILPTQTLLWHYRSRHEHLIAFSNTKIYNGNLTTFPSSVEKTRGMGVEYLHVPTGTYDRGGKNGNKAEATKVAELVFEHFRTYPNRSLGIIAFGEVQQSAIQDALLEKRRANLAFEPFFKEDKEESLFIKNLETVQGDERDTVLFSIGYAPDATGKFIMNFGPLSRDGGERRLNVAVTRARYNLKLIGSILPTDIDPERVSGQGPKLLRLYIDFAINGATAILGEINAESGGWFDSPFEASVHKFLTGKGFDVVTQVGCSGYRIDMAVRHPKYPGRFAIGIECDGAMYHSARTARERDRLRQSVLEDMGWKIYRIWSTDWIKDRHTEGERLLIAVKNAIDNYREIAPNSSAPTVKMSDFLSVSAQTVQESIQEGVQEKYSRLRSRYFNYKADSIPINDIVETMKKVLLNDFGLDKNGLYRETALYGYNYKRLVSSITNRFDKALEELVRQKIIEEDNGKFRIIHSI